MAKKIKDTDYLYISTRLKVLEKFMLGRDKLTRMAGAKTDDEALKVLGENGWLEVTAGDSASLDASIAARRQETLDLLYRYAPDRRIIDIFRFKYDYHNIKAYVKGEVLGESFESLLSAAGTVAPATLVTALRERREDEIEPAMFSSAQDALDLLARTKDPQLSDILLDKAMMTHMEMSAKQSKSRFLQNYVKLFIDCANLRILTRAKLTAKGLDYINRALCEGGNVKLLPFTGEITAEGVIGMFNFGPLQEAAHAASDAISDGASLMALDKACDNALLEYLKDSRFIPFGEAQVITYLLLLENELTSVRLIMAGRAAGMSEENIIERLRLGYYV